MADCIPSFDKSVTKNALQKCRLESTPGIGIYPHTASVVQATCPLTRHQYFTGRANRTSTKSGACDER